MLPLLAAAGGIMAGIAGIKSAKNQKRAVNAQAGIAQNQNQLFQTGIPYYQQLLQQAGSMAGLGKRMPGGVNSLYGVPNQNLGLFASPDNQARLSQAEELINRQTRQGMDQLSFGLGRRGLAGSSIDASARAALLADANRSRAGFARGLAMQAPQEQQQRLAFMAGLLNPAFGAGPAASNIYGQQAQMYGGQAQQAFGGLGQSLQNFLMYDQMRRMNNRNTMDDFMAQEGWKY